MSFRFLLKSLRINRFYWTGKASFFRREAGGRTCMVMPVNKVDVPSLVDYVPLMPTRREGAF